MFTGIIRDVGRVLDVVPLGQGGSRVVVVTSLQKNLFELGCSVACNGACLTVVDFHEVPSTQETLLEFDVGPETLARTTWGSAQKGRAVNLEPALRAGDSLGGHEVLGHVDTLGRVVSFEQTNDSGFWRLRIEIQGPYLTYCIPQGSVTLAGVSLTLAAVEALEAEGAGVCIEIMIVPHTLEKTHFANLKAEDSLEVEFDCRVKTIVQTVKALLPGLLPTSPHTAVR